MPEMSYHKTSTIDLVGIPVPLDTNYKCHTKLNDRTVKWTIDGQGVWTVTWKSEAPGIEEVMVLRAPLDSISAPTPDGGGMKLHGKDVTIEFIPEQSAISAKEQLS